MLEVIRVDGAEGNTHSDTSATVVLCHGFGADALDLASLARQVSLPFDVQWVFPQAPVEFQMGWGTGRAWFPRDAAGLQAFLTGEQFAALAQVDPPGLTLAAGEISELLVSCGDPTSVVLGGFSQGAMVAAATALTLEPVPAGLLLFSGSVIAEERLLASARANRERLQGLPVVQFHGSEDPVLPFHNGRRLADVLETAGMELQFIEFAGGHGIPPELLPGVAGHLERMLKPR